MPMLNRLIQLAGSPKGRRALDQAVRYAKSDKGRAKLDQARRVVATRRRPPR